jgi:NADH-quinone oxidoreductase subunit F
MRGILTDICEGRGEASDLALLEELCGALQDASLCALGKSAPNPVASTLRYFRDEYEAHIHGKYCPAGVCPKLTSFGIDEEKCIGCGLCAKACPAGAIRGTRKAPHSIDESKCLSCGACREICRFDAAVAKKKAGRPV